MTSPKAPNNLYSYLTKRVNEIVSNLDRHETKHGCRKCHYPLKVWGGGEPIDINGKYQVQIMVMCSNTYTCGFHISVFEYWTEPSDKRIKPLSPHLMDATEYFKPYPEPPKAS